MLPAVRILYTLGVRRLYLLGCDFSMSQENTYHFDQSRASGSVKGNSQTYEKLNGWFKELRPLFEQQDFRVFNCNPDSNLKAFDHVPFQDALSEALAHMDGVDIANERTRGLYDTKTEDKEKGVGK
jgi:hypothetical protein